MLDDKTDYYLACSFWPHCCHSNHCPPPSVLNASPKRVWKMTCICSVILWRKEYLVVKSKEHLHFLCANSNAGDPNTLSQDKRYSCQSSFSKEKTVSSYSHWEMSNQRIKIVRYKALNTFMLDDEISEVCLQEVWILKRRETSADDIAIFGLSSKIVF